MITDKYFEINRHELWNPDFDAKQFWQYLQSFMRLYPQRGIYGSNLILIWKSDLDKLVKDK